MCRRVAVETATTTVLREESADVNAAPNTTMTLTTAVNDAHHDTTHTESGDITIDTPGDATITTLVTANVGIALRLVVAHLG